MFGRLMDCQNERPAQPALSQAHAAAVNALAKADLRKELLAGGIPALPESPQQRETRLRYRPVTVTSSDAVFLCRLLDESRIALAGMVELFDGSAHRANAAKVDAAAWLADRPTPPGRNWIDALHRDYVPPA